MTPEPTARLTPVDGRRDRSFTRTFIAPIDDVWASITESERTARWFASWSGQAGPGRTIRYRMELEEGAPEGDMLIEACEPPHHLAVRTVDAFGSWHLEARLAAAGGVTTLTCTHHLDDGAALDDVGPGWEYDLDALVASRQGAPLPSFDDYLPQQAWFEALEQQLRRRA